MKQLSFFPPPLREHGGDFRKGRRKTQRPFDPKRPIHVTLRSSRARGSWSLLTPRHRLRVQALLIETTQRRHVRVYRFANVGTHVHLLIQVRTRRDFQAFLREFAGVIAAHVTGAIKGRPEKFWDDLAWSKIVEWGRGFKNASDYVLLNVLESSGFRDRGTLARLQRDGFVFLHQRGS